VWLWFFKIEETVRMLLVRLWALQYPRKHRAAFPYYYRQWRGTDRPEGGFWWARNVFGEYEYPGWGLPEGMG
jgi:hypothetical protein